VIVAGAIGIEIGIGIETLPEKFDSDSDFDTDFQRAEKWQE